MRLPAISRQRVLHAAAAALVMGLTACGGGGGGGTTATVPTVSTGLEGFGPASPERAGVIAATNGCDAVIAPAGTEFVQVRNYKVYQGDCVISLTVDAATWTSFTTDRARLKAPSTINIARDFSLAFQDTFDFLLVLLDNGSPYAPTGFQSGEYTSLNTRTPQRTRTLLGTVFLPALMKDPTDKWTAIEGGPLLHEILHEWANYGAISTAEVEHWGFSSAGGQLGGWGYLTDLGSNRYQGFAPDKCFTAETTPTAINGQRLLCTGPKGRFSAFANGGNAPKYSKLEKFVMGLLPAGQLGTIQVANQATWIDYEKSIFSAASFTSISESQIAANMGSTFIPFDKSQKSFRVATLVITSSNSLPKAKVDVLNQSLANFTMDGFPGYPYVVNYGNTTDPNSSTGKVAVLNNFYTSTDGAARLRANGIFANRR